MKESSDRSDVSRSARAVAPGSARRIATDGEGRPSPTRRAPSVEQELSNNDSFSEERFISPTSMHTSSWESQSFDSGEPNRSSSRPSSRSSLRDRRKQFDTTTPTLIDEEEEEEPYEDEEEMLSLEHARLHGYAPKDDSSIRLTPGATMYKSSFETDLAHSMRRTPGASAMLQAAAPQGEIPINEEEAVGLGFGFTLSPPGSEDQTKREKTRIWESYSSHSATPSPTLRAGRSREVDAPSRPPLAPTPSAITTGSRQQEARGPFSFTPWARAKSPTTSNESDPRPGAFSPNILRLTEDIGNLLQEDEDDDYAFEIPSVFRGDGEDLSEFGGDWMGSYVFGSDPMRKRQGKVVRPGTVGKEKSRRHRSTVQQPHGLLPNAQQPKPRRSGNELFEFGKTRDERASPQLLNFGGAFAPPAKDYSGTVMRPLASSGSSFAAGNQSQGAGAFGATGTGVGAFGVHAESFDSSFQSSQGVQVQGGPYFQQNRYSSPSPVYESIQQSDMQATASEFVPMAARSAPSPGAASSPSAASPYPGHQSPYSGQQSPYPGQQSPYPGQHESPSEQAGWQTSSPFQYGGGYNFGMQTQGMGSSQSGMSPSPQFSAWQQGDPSMYGGVQPSHAEPGHSSLVSPVVPQGAPASDISKSDQQRSKKEGTKRGKRGKKKSQKADASATGKKGAGTKKKKDPSRPGSATQSQDETLISTSEDPGDLKRAELVESPTTRIAFKDFYRTFRSEERLTFQKAEEFALQALDDGSLPGSVHWRVYLELADLAKRSNRYIEARRLYQKVCQLQPYASQGWLEYSKLEEECGHVNRVTNILLAGLEYCEYSENLLTRAVKHQEKLGNLDSAHELLARLKHVGIDKVWRTVLEGALLEARAGNHSMARRVLKYLMHHVPWYGPLYLEAYRLERDQNNPKDAFAVVERGLAAMGRYGPLWFGAFRLCEEMDMARKDYHLPNALRMIKRATVGISKELVWKVHLEAAQMLERAALEQVNDNASPSLDTLLTPTRKRIAMTILTCPNNLRWKVWLAAARMELGIGNTERSRALFLRAHRVVPEKGRSATLLECARLEEFIGDSDLARCILCKARVEYSHDWKVLLESVLLEIRGGYFKRAMEINTSALELHQGTGRLWSTLVQLSQITGGDVAQHEALVRALNAVPKSGEVWCEGGRIHLNPFSDTFDPDRARRHLSFATRFTPQYGDSFIETLRLELLDQWLMPIATFIWDKTKSSYSPARTPKEEDPLTKYITDVSLAVSVACQQEGSGSRSGIPRIAHSHIVSTVRERLKPETFRKTIDLTELRLACANADPNYGSLWFHCRRVSTDTPRRVIEDAAEDVADELQKYAHIYIAALMRLTAVLSTADQAPEDTSPEYAAWEKRVDEKLRSAPSLQEIFNPMDPTTGLVLLHTTIGGPDFVTGLTDLNKHRPINVMSLADRRKALFGTDALFP